MHAGQMRGRIVVISERILLISPGIWHYVRGGRQTISLLLVFEKLSWERYFSYSSCEVTPLKENTASKIVVCFFLEKINIFYMQRKACSVILMWFNNGLYVVENVIRFILLFARFVIESSPNHEGRQFKSCFSSFSFSVRVSRWSIFKQRVPCHKLIY